MKNFTIIPNNLLQNSQLSIPARYLFCVLLRYCGKKEWCFPSQKTLANDLGFSERYIRILVKELEIADLIYKKRRGYNRSNNYQVAKDLNTHRNYGSSHLGSTFPLHQGNHLPTNSIYLIGKDNNAINHKGLEKLRRKMIESKILPDGKLIISRDTK